MKFILIFIFSLISGLSLGLKGSQHYKFKYFSSFMSEIPQDGDQASGVSLKAVLDVYLENNDGIAIFKLSDVTIVEFLEKLGSDEDTEFSDDRFQTPTDKVFLNALQQPFRVNLRGSEPFSIEYEETEERWLSNVRKGIASVFKNEILKGNFETQDEKDSISSLFHEGHLVNIFSVEEETIFGICKVTYEIHEINEGLITPENEFFSSWKIDSNEDLWRVVRSVDFDKCNEKVILNINSLNEKRNKGQKPKYTRSSVSTYLLSGSPGHFDLYGVVVEGVMTYPLSFFDEHEAHSTTKQKLILIDQGPNEELPTLGPNLKQSTTWMYVVWSPFTQPKGSKPLPWIVYSDENVFNQPNEIYGSRPFTSDQISQLKVQILEDIETASKVLTDINYETKDSLLGTIPDTLNKVTYYFKMLSKEDIIKIFDHIYERKVKLESRLIIDAAAASGSHNAFEAILDYISADKLKPYQIKNVFLTLGSSEGTLNITRILDYVLNVNLEENEAGVAVWLNFAHYLKEFCIHKTHNYIPVKELFYEDCALVTGKFIQNLRDVTYNETLTWERPFAVKVLEALQIDTSFNILTPLFNGTNNAPNELKAMALRALKNSHPDRDRTQSLLRKPAMDLLKEVYSDFNKDFQVRAAALLSFISWQPSTNFWNKLAKDTWNDPSKDFSSFSSNLINLYANKKFPATENQWKDAYSASKLAKPSYHYDDSSSSLFNYFFKDYAKLILGVNEKFPPSLENFAFEILTKEKDLSLLKFEINAMFSKAYEGPFSDKTPQNEFVIKFMKEIGYYFNYYDEFKTTQNFFQNLGGSLNTQAPHRPTDSFNFEKDAEDENIYYSGRFLKLVESSDFFPNELGLPTFAFGSIPMTFSFTTKNLPQKPGQVFVNQYLMKASAIYIRGVGVYLPWSLKSHNAMIRSSIELNIPVGIKEKRSLGIEGEIGTVKSHLNIGFEKKFPALRLSKTPMTITLGVDPVNHNPVINFVPIKKSSGGEKVIREVHPITGIKYDLNMRADTKSDFGLNDFSKYPKVPFGFWSFEFYINPEESETKEIIFVISHGYLKKSEETTESFDSKQNFPKISNSDTLIERSEKLKKAFGQSLNYFGVEFSFVGQKERNYELFFTNTEGSNLLTRNMIGMTRSQIPGSSSQSASLCIKMSKKTPSTPEMNSVFISKTNISQEIKIKLLYNCSLPILKAHAFYSMSDEGKDDTTKKCNNKYSNCKYDNAEFISEWKLFYDTIDIDAFYETNTESFDLAVTENILDSLRNWIDLSSIKKFTDDTHHGNLTLRIHRNTYHKNWDILLKTPSSNVLLATYPDTPLFTFFSGVKQNRVPLSLLDMLYGDKSSTDAKCILQRNSVTTFDGVHYIYEPSTCWTLASHSHSPWNTIDYRSVFLVRASKEPSKILEFKYLNYASHLEIEFSNEELKVNGIVVDRLFEDSPDFRIIEEGTIYKIGYSYHIYSFIITTRIIEINNVQSPHIIVYEDKIEIYNEYLKGSTANGICGNNDGRMIPEFIGPKHCIYNDAQMFAASWTGQSDDCDAATVEEYRKGVDHFQADCKPYQKNIQDIQMNERCLVFQWKISTFNETNYCISAKPLPFCLEKCQTNKYKRVKVTYKCWPKANAPEVLIPLIENQNKTFVSAPITAEPYFYEPFYEDVAKFCKQF